MNKKIKSFLENIIIIIVVSTIIAGFSYLLATTDFVDIGASQDHFVIQQIDEDGKSYSMSVGYHFGDPFVPNITKVADTVKILNPHGNKSFLRVYKVYEGYDFITMSNASCTVEIPNWEDYELLCDIHDQGTLTGNYYRIETYMYENPEEAIISRNLVLID